MRDQKGTAVNFSRKWITSKFKFWPPRAGNRPITAWSFQTSWHRSVLYIPPCATPKTQTRAGTSGCFFFVSQYVSCISMRNFQIRELVNYPATIHYWNNKQKKEVVFKRSGKRLDIRADFTLGKESWPHLSLRVQLLERVPYQVASSSKFDQFVRR